MTRIRFATIWLDGCSGCHMSFLDLDERLIDLADRVEVVYSPLVDTKDYPAAVDLCLVEGAVSSEEDLHKIILVRERTRTLVAFGDCAVTTNVPGMRNTFGSKAILERAYVDNACLNRRPPSEEVPRLLPVAVPVHHVVPVDSFLPGCPPSADLIWQILTELLDGKTPDPARLARFGK